jgi:hypothetical protein
MKSKQAMWFVVYQSNQPTPRTEILWVGPFRTKKQASDVMLYELSIFPRQPLVLRQLCVWLPPQYWEVAG